jgi:hypothetical protein
MNHGGHAKPGSAKLLKRVALVCSLMLVLIGGGLTLASLDVDGLRTDHDTLSIGTVEHGALEIRISASGRSRATDLGTIQADLGNDPMTDQLRFQVQLRVGPLLLQLRLRFI